MALIEALQRNITIANNGCQEIVEVVSDPARQLPNGFHLLCLPELFLQVPPFGNVAGNTLDSD
jgi:hypothetical protein